jgi:hypothetical protein
MRVTRRVSMAASAIVMAAVLNITAQDDKANQVMARVRTALGGEQKLTTVRTLSLRATYQREMSMPGMTGGGRAMIVMNDGPAAGGTPQVSGELEIDVELPSRYIRIDTSTGVMATTRTEGFDGTRPFAHAASANPGMRIRIDPPGDDPDRAKQALRRNRAELARLLLGILGAPQASFPVTYTYAGVAESPDGTADMIDVKGPEDFAVRLFVDAKTHLPLMLTYTAPEPRIVMRTAERQRAGESAERERLANDLRQAEGAPPTLVEHRIFFSDYRNAGGLSLPHRIARGTVQKTTEEWEVKSYKINPRFEADRFKVS